MFLIMWAASLLAHFGNSVQSVGAQWLMTDMDGRADMVALVQTAITAPVMLLALVGGAIADSYDRRKVMLGAQVIVAFVSTGLAVMTYQGLITPWLLLSFTFAIGLNMAFYNPAAQASISRIVPREEIAGAVSLNILAFNVARTLGPAIGGALVAIGGALTAFVFNALSCIAAVILLLFWRPQSDPPREGPRARIPQAIGEGLRCVWNSPPLRAAQARCLFFTLCGSAIWALMPLVARDLTGGGAEQFGLLLGGLGGGAVLGAAFSHAIRQRFDGEGLVRLSAGIVGLALLIVSLQPGFIVTLVVLLIGGAAWVQALSGFSVAGQMWAPRALVGRVMATNSTMLFGGLAIGSWIWGHVAESFGVAVAIGCSGLTMFLIGALGIIMPLAPTRDAPAE